MIYTKETIRRLQEHVWRLVWLVILLARSTIDSPQVERKILLAGHLQGFAGLVGRLLKRLEELGVELEPDPGGEAPSLPEAFGRGLKPLDLIAGGYFFLLGTVKSEAESHLNKTSTVSDGPTVLVLCDLVSACGEHAAEIEDAEDPILLPPLRSVTEHLSTAAALHACLVATLPSTPARDSRLLRAAEAARPLAEDLSVREAAIHFLHHNITELEIPTIEACSRLIIEFPSMPWSFKEDMARQAWDEARHAAAFIQRLEELGGKLGSFAHDHALWRMATGQPLSIRLALHQRIGERIGVDAALWNAARFRELGDSRTAEILDYVTLDEVTHVKFGNRWLRHLVKDQAELDQVHDLANDQRGLYGKSDVGRLIFPFNRWACEHEGFASIEVARLEERWLRLGSIMPGISERAPSTRSG